MKYLLAVIFGVAITLVAVAFFYKGKQYAPTSLQQSLSPTVAISPTASPTSTPTPTSASTKIVSGGGVLSFPKYELTVPIDWADSKEILGSDAERVVLKKGSYQISITQGGFGGAICLFPGDPDIEGPSGRYDTFVPLTTKSGNLFRRVGVAGKGGFSICEKTQYGWNAPSSYGHISILTPSNPDNKSLEEIDSIITSLTQK